MRHLRLLAALSLLTIPLGIAVAGAGSVDDAIRRFAQAEALRAEGSYERAHVLYAAVDRAGLSDVERRWVDLRTADTAWRAAAANPAQGDPALRDARARLEELIAQSEKAETRDRIWAEAQESLADLTARSDRGGDDQHYLAALGWWGESSDIDLARQRYLAIVWRMTSGFWAPDSAPYRRYSAVPVEILENALKIAVTPSDRARAAYLLARNLESSGNEQARDRIEDAFEIAIRIGRSADWYDDALHWYGQWLERTGRAVELETGEWRYGPDYEKALTIYRRLVSEFRDGETPFLHSARARITDITSPWLFVSAPGVFVPGSEIELMVRSRNVDSISFEIVPVDLVRDLSKSPEMVSNWIPRLDPKAAPVAAWARTIDPRGDRYTPHSETIRVEQELKRGAYVLRAKAGPVSATELILVSETAVVLRTSPTETIAYVADAVTGEPVAGANVRVFEEHLSPSRTVEMHEDLSDANGLARFRSTRTAHNQLLVVASKNDRQAFVQSYGGAPSARPDGWRIYAFTDRSAYRPGETVRWKITARLNSPTGYRTPAGRKLRYEITGPRGAKVATGSAELNAFGSFWTDLPLAASMPLGLYTVSFTEESQNRPVGAATLFRLEEYKLPEFQVSVEMPKEDARPKVFRLGDRVTATIRAEYYFGGGVPNANVEVVVRQTPFFHYWRRPVDFGWYQDAPARRPYYGGGEVVVREVLRTDAEGKAEISFDTPRGAQNDLEYSIEARVTDASRREIVGSGRVRVSRQSYFVTATPEHHVHRPGAKATIDFHSEDANGNPVPVTGTVRVVMQRTIEVWRDPSGRRFEGAELERERERHPMFPPPPRDGRPWTLVRRTAEEVDVLTRSVTTDQEGNGSFTFTPERDGTYRIVWTSDDRRDPSRPKRPSDVVRAETTIWVATAATRRLGGYHGGLEIIVDRDTVRAGETVHVMIVAPVSGMHVLFGVEAEEIFESRLLKLEGDAKLVEIAIDEKHVPNFFVTAHAVSNLQLASDTERIVVPPVRQFIDVKVTPGASETQPGSSGKLTVSTLDHLGQPVASEVAVSVADLSVEAIQSELAVDPRAFFYGNTRPHSVSTTSSFATRQYVRILPHDREERDEEAVELQAAAPSAMLRDVEGRAVGGVVAESATVMPAPPPAPAAPRAKAESSPTVSQEPAVTVRSDFRSTALWIPDVKTGATGVATVDVKYPDSLTTWKTTATAATVASQFGRGTAAVRTRKPLMVRLQGPRFLVAGDEGTISAVVNNGTAEAMTVAVSLALDGLEVVAPSSQTVEVAADGDARVDWKVVARTAGEARLRVTGRAGTESDGMERTLPVFEHGIDKLVAVSGRTRGSDTAAFVEIPKERRRESTELTVQVTPSIAVTMLDALPYLVEFPYGCTEQTMSRFLPAVITLKTLADLGLSREDAAWRIFGGIEQSSAAATHRQSTGGLERLDAVMKVSLDRLYDFQHADGGWGWWKEGSSDPYMTGYVVWGLALARDAGLPLRSSSLERGVKYLQTTLVEREEWLDEQAWMLHALALARKGAAPEEFEAKAIENIWQNRDRLRPYSRALYAIALQSYGSRERAQVLIRNLENGAQIDRTPDRSIVSRGGSDAGAETLATARWGERGFWWRWWDGPVESTAFVLRALVAVDPKHPLVEPAMNWLVKNRRGAQWSSTKETAIAVLALNDYLRASGELKSEGSYEIVVNGTPVAKQSVTAATVLRAPSRYRIEPALVRDGRNEVRIVRTGGNAELYFGAEARFFSLEEPVTAAGNQLFVKRSYFRLAGRPTLLAGYVYDRVPLDDGASIASGERIEVVVQIETKNDLEYLIFEDLKPAGFEAVALQSGASVVATRLAGAARSSVDGRGVIRGTPAGSRLLHQELRDRKVAMFADRLDQGVWELKYTLRAETPGTFHALPLLGAAMYVPEIRANGEEVRVTVSDEKR